jgi:ABC-type transport system involved in multi-copper enzyme maturation permease subunit
VSVLEKVMARPLNPVLARELKERMRRRRSTVVLSVYLVVLCLVLWLLYLGFSVGGDVDGPGALRIASLGRTAFQTLLFFMLLLVCFIVPGLCAGAVAGERERQTLVPLQVTLLTPRSILFGKLSASLAFVVFLILASLPFIGVSFVLGGVEAGEVVRGVGMVIVTAAVVGCLSLVCSSLMRRTQGATVLSYAMVLVLLGGTFVAFGAQMLADQRGPAGRMQAMMWANPLMATADVLSRQTGDNLIPTPFTELQNLIDERLDTNRDGMVAGRDGGRFGFGPRVFVENAVGVGMPVFDDVIEVGPGADPAAAGPDLDDPSLLHRAPFWLLSVLTWAVVCGLGFWWACRRLRTPVDGVRPA